MQDTGQVTLGKTSVRDMSSEWLLCAHPSHTQAGTPSPAKLMGLVELFLGLSSPKFPSAAGTGEQSPTYVFRCGPQIVRP